MPLVVPFASHPSAAGASRARRARTLRAVVAAGALALPLAACTPAISLTAGPHATDPVCASIVLAVPDTLGALPKITASAQAAAAWGTTASAVTLRCGVEPPGPTTTQCQAIVDATGASVDWIVVEEPVTGDWVFTTYGRVPAVEVRIPAGTSGAAVVDLNRAVSAAPQTRHCY
ncbi:DUF3515 family protein [Sanguibacter sp. A247]|uniref:DUF3515 family protein n=1 Tax=unclassified Sanguibacter TaxID=2645534 RepID=UPI003FD739EF